MNTGAIVMLLIGAVCLWGGALLAIVNYLRQARGEPPGPPGERRDT